MDTQSGSLRLEGVQGRGRSSLLQKAALGAWLLITLASMVSLVLSIYSLNLWDRIPAVDAPRYFSGMTPEGIQQHADWQAEVMKAGLSLAGYAAIFTVARSLAGLALLGVSLLLALRYRDRPLALALAALLSLFAATGLWANALYDWGVAIAPWMKIPAQILGWLTRCSAIVIFIFPDGKFNPRWTRWLAVLLVPLGFLMAFQIDIFLNPTNWPPPFYLFPDVVFIGGALLALLVRFSRADLQLRRALLGYTLGLVLLIGLHFLYLFLTQVYDLVAGHELFETAPAFLRFVLRSEPIWFAAVVLFAAGVAISVFREKLLDRQ
ncbi:MAG TPA: hypothetical protein VIV15_11745 [Anaerolineales bacterium]